MNPYARDVLRKQIEFIDGELHMLEKTNDGLYRNLAVNLAAIREHVFNRKMLLEATDQTAARIAESSQASVDPASTSDHSPPRS